MSYRGPLLIRGDKLACAPQQPFQAPGASYGQQGHGLVVKGATGLGSPQDMFRFTWTQNVVNPQQCNSFMPGQGWRVDQYCGRGDPVRDQFHSSWKPVYGHCTPVWGHGAGPGRPDDCQLFQTRPGHGHHPNQCVVFDPHGHFGPRPNDCFYPRPGHCGPPHFHDCDGAICFTRGTMIATPEGERAIETLGVGDLVLTRDHGAQPIRWIGARVMSHLQRLRPHLRPIRIPAGALGAGTFGGHVPATDLVVSPQHRVLLRSGVALNMLGEAEVLVAAKQLCGVNGIAVVEDCDEIEYFHMMFERHEVVISNGAETESLLPGTEALLSVGAAARSELFDIFPDLMDGTPAPARLIATGRQGRKLAERHQRHGQPFVAAA